MNIEINFPPNCIELLAQCTGYALQNGYGQFSCELRSRSGAKKVRIIVLPEEMGSDPFDFSSLGKPKLELINGSMGKKEST